MPPPVTIAIGWNYPNHRHATPGDNLERVELSQPPACHPRWQSRKGGIIPTTGMPPPVTISKGWNYPNHRHATPGDNLERVELSQPPACHPRWQSRKGGIIPTTGMPPPVTILIGWNYPNHRHATPGDNLERVELSQPPACRPRWQSWKGGIIPTTGMPPPVTIPKGWNYPNHRHATPGDNLERVELSQPPACHPRWQSW